MAIEREVLVSTLKMTGEGRAPIGEIGQDARVPLQTVRNILRKNSEIGIVQLSGKFVVAEEEQRLKVASRAIELGADIERVCSFLKWEEFEDISILAFEANDFQVRKHFRFRWLGRRWEIDILGFKEPVIVSADCKHWHRGWAQSASGKAAESQIERTRALATAASSSRGRIGIEEWRHAYFVPVILSLVPPPFKFHRGVPIVPVLQMRNFLQEMPARIDEIAHISQSFTSP